jgi:uncharacterized protein (DUF58 family)
MIRLTPSGKVFLGVIVVMHLASITAQSGLLIWIVGLIAACLIVNGFAAARSVKHIKLQAPARILIEQGTTSREPWQLTNQGKRPARLITIELQDTIWVRATEIPAGATVQASPQNVFQKRGVFPLNQASIVSTYPFGLVKAKRPIQSAAEVLVFPKLYEAPAPAVRGLDPMIGGRHTGAGRVQVGEKFAGVRMFQDGDSLKQIHWKSSAKGRGLMVKTFEEELAGRATLLVHCDGPSPQCEACIRAAGSLALAGIEAGHQIEFHNLNEGRAIRTPPFGDTTRLFEELARFDPSASAAIKLPDSFPPRSAVHFICTALTPEIRTAIEGLQSEGKLVVLHLPTGATEQIDCALEHFPTP